MRCNLNVRTFHSFGLQILRTYGDLLGYQADFGIISNTTKNKYLRDILGRLGIERREISAYGNAISRVKNGLPVDSASMPTFAVLSLSAHGGVRRPNCNKWEQPYWAIQRQDGGSWLCVSADRAKSLMRR